MNRAESLTLLVAALLSAVCFASAWDWKEGTNGLVRWDNNCDFPEDDIQQVNSQADQCGGICIANHRCTHFAHSNGVCYVKQDGDGEFAVYNQGAICGYAINRGFTVDTD